MADGAIGEPRLSWRGPLSGAKVLKIPPLNAVRAFEAAARHVSFTKAAEELNVTRGAVSRQVALLEEWLGHPLFVRSSSQVMLTNAGRNFLIEASAALVRLASASAFLIENPETTLIRLNAPPTFTMRWLITRMSTFQRQHPELELRVTTFRPTDVIRQEEYDVAIRGGLGPIPGYSSDAFMSERVIPVCHPDLLGNKKHLEIDDLRQQTLITYSSETYKWPEWLEAVGAPTLKPAGVLRFDPMYFALQAAQEGLGLLLLPLFNVIDDLLTGRLCAPFGTLGMAYRRAYFVSRPVISDAASAVEVFCDWLKTEGMATDRSIDEWIASLTPEPEAPGV